MSGSYYRSENRRDEMDVHQMMPLNRRASSRDSMGRYSERSLHSNYRVNRSVGGKCKNFMARIPYGTLIATIMCLVGVGIFCGTMYRGATLTILMFDHVFKIHITWLETVQMTFVIIGASMGALGLMILIFGCLSTGATREEVYRAWKARVGGRITCAVFMVITYILLLAWLLILCCLVIITVTFMIFWGLCSYRERNNKRCIDLTQFDFLFPDNTRPEDKEVCEPNEVKMFCKDFVEHAVVMYILASVACLLIILSLVHYLMCLSANYAHIRDHQKIQELQELQYLHDTHTTLTCSKDRF